MPEAALSSRFQLGRYQLQHRIVLAPLTRSRGTERDGAGNESVANELMATYYGQRATAGGLLVSEAAPVCAAARFAAKTPSLHSAAHAAAWTRATAAVAARGGVFFAQLWHLGMHCRPPLDPLRRAPPAPVARARPADGVATRALSCGEIAEVAALYAAAARHAIDAGFHGVEIHAANGYLIDQFLNDNINTRTDHYGSQSLENKCRFAIEVTRAVVDAIGADRVGIRLSPWNKFGGMDDSDPVATWCYLLEALNDIEGGKLAYVHLVEPRVAGAGDSLVPVNTEVVNLDAFRKVWKGPLIVAGGYLPDSAEAAVKEGRSDLVAFGRYFISNPDLVTRIQKGLPLAKYDRSTFQVGEEVGYTDYKAWDEKDEI
ncbi:putative NADH-dependent flavin oxidoreductase [Obelidium mucronatum]|nr:putative NADH-dependent flavin oxidoreductase [Obelidium mucronatum]